jgi:hypothetical protein
VRDVVEADLGIEGGNLILRCYGARHALRWHRGVVRVVGVLRIADVLSGATGEEQGGLLGQYRHDILRDLVVTVARMQ